MRARKSTLNKVLACCHRDRRFKLVDYWRGVKELVMDANFAMFHYSNVSFEELSFLLIRKSVK